MDERRLVKIARAPSGRINISRPIRRWKEGLEVVHSTGSMSTPEVQRSSCIVCL